MQSLLPIDECIAVEEAHRKIDEAIVKHEEFILALKSQRNHFAPISRLPPEIVCRIFLFAKTQDQSHYGRLYHLRWIKLTHVTRHWRNIAVNSPSLWVDPPVKNIRWVEEMLQRSKDASLVIQSDLGSDSYSIHPGLELALKQSERVKDLSFQNVSAGMWYHLQKQLPKSAPRLQYLTLDGYPNYAIHPGSQRMEPISITGPILCETKRLRHVELTNCNLNWDSHSHLLCSLTHLKLHNLSPVSRPTGKQFVDVLKGVPNLKYLDLKDVLPIQIGKEVSWGTEHIHFASLQTLSLCSGNTEIEPFFSCVTFPPTTTVKVICAAADTAANTLASRTDFSGFISSLARSYSNCSSARTFQTIILKNTDTGGLGLQVKLHTEALMNDQMLLKFRYTPSLELEFLWKTRVLTAEKIVNELISHIFGGAIHLQHVTGIYLGETEYRLHDETIARTIGTLPQVRSMTTVNYSGRTLFDALKLPHEEGTQSASGAPVSSICFPRLSSIYLYDVRFDDLDELTIENVQDCLIQRYESGAEIEKLTFQECRRLKQQDIDLLTQIVVDVDWDGEEIITDSDTEDEDEAEPWDEYEYNTHDEYSAEDFDDDPYGGPFW